MVFAIGDIHGHYKRFMALMLDEGLIKAAPDGVDESNDKTFFNGLIRDRRDVTVVQLGDFIHAGHDSVERDAVTVQAVNKWCDVVLWGNHDRSIVDPDIAFNGLYPPNSTTLNELKNMIVSGKIRLAFNAYGYLLTHAGLHSFYETLIQETSSIEWEPDRLDRLVSFLNHTDSNLRILEDYAKYIKERTAFDEVWDRIVNSIGFRRGGFDHDGGILWRDFEEDLYSGFRQVFGHSANRQRVSRTVTSKKANGDLVTSYCIDIGGRKDIESDNYLAGIYLPHAKVRSVNDEKINVWAEMFPDGCDRQL